MTQYSKSGGHLVRTTKIWYYSTTYSIPKSYESENKICDFDKMLTRLRGHFHAKIDIDPEIEVSVTTNQVFLETRLVIL